MKKKKLQIFSFYLKLLLTAPLFTRCHDRIYLHIWFGTDFYPGHPPSNFCLFWVLNWRPFVRYTNVLTTTKQNQILFICLLSSLQFVILVFVFTGCVFLGVESKSCCLNLLDKWKWYDSLRAKIGIKIKKDSMHRAADSYTWVNDY